MFEGSNDFYDERYFNRIFDLERKRSIRSQKPFIVILIDIKGFIKPGPQERLNRLLKALASSFRDTDLRGWYIQESVIGVIFTELNSVGEGTRAILFNKMQAALATHMDPDDLRKIYVTFLTYPSSHGDAVSCGRFDLERYADRMDPHARMRSPSAKRLTDVTGSLGKLAKLVPAFFSHLTSKI